MDVAWPLGVWILLYPGKTGHDMLADGTLVPLFPHCFRQACTGGDASFWNNFAMRNLQRRRLGMHHREISLTAKDDINMFRCTYHNALAGRRLPWFIPPHWIFLLWKRLTWPSPEKTGQTKLTRRLEFQKVIAGLSTVHVILHTWLCLNFHKICLCFTRAIGTESDG
jgi:hypothetical protein